MILFNSDLDNTLIYSHKREMNEEKSCVEIYQQREVSFMSNTSLKLLHKLNQNILFVPTTTRTREQYERINFGIGIPKYALVCNGGILLVDGIMDKEWYEESIDQIKECKTQLQYAIEILEKDVNRCFEIRFIDDLFIFTKSDNPQMTIDYLSTYLDLALVDIFQIGIKVYVIPKKLTKGNAVLRLKKKLKADKVIVAGDSEFDLSMFQVADLAFAPKQLITRMDMEQSNGKNQCSNIIVHEGGQLFSDAILKYIMKHEINNNQ